MLVPRVRVVFVVNLRSGSIDTSPHLLPPLRAAVAVLDTVIVTAITFLLLFLLLLLVLRLLTEK